MQENDQNLLTTRAQLAVALSDAHRNKSLLDATIKSTASGVVVCDLDVNFIFINPAGRRMLGKIAELGPEHWSDSLGLFESEDGRLFDETELPLGRACRGENVDRMEILIRNGISDQPRWLEANATQILDLDDQPIGAVTVFNDITSERKEREGLRDLQIQTESKLVDTNRQLEDVLNTIQEAIWRGVETEQGFSFVYFSPAIEKITGFKPDQLTCQVGIWNTHVHPQDQQRIKSLISKMSSEKIDGAEIDFRLIHADGSIRWVQNRIRAVTNDQARFLQGTMSDITSERDAKLSFARAERLASVGTLAAGIAHEINNPLSAMLMTIELGKRRHENGTLFKEEVVDVFEDVAKQIERCAEIVEGVLKFASDETSSRNIEPLEPIFHESRELIKFKAQKRKIEIVVHESESPQPLANISATEIVQVVANLLANAVDASPNGSRIDIFTRTENDRVIVSVVDYGLGMTLEEEQSAFDPFFTSKRETGGTGLGLSMSHRIIANHYGEIWIEKTTPNEGTTLSFWLPLASANN